MSICNQKQARGYRQPNLPTYYKRKFCLFLFVCVYGCRILFVMCKVTKVLIVKDWLFGGSL